MFDLAVHGRAYVGELAPSWVYVKDGAIAKVSKERAGPASQTIELEPGQFLIPAATDLHVHLRDWSQAKKETVETGTRSALAGGVTTVADMPNTVPRLDGPELVERRVKLLRRSSLADFAVHAAPPEFGEYRHIRESGAFAVKLYPPDLDEFPVVLKKAGRAGLKVAVHAEDASMVARGATSGAELVAIERILQEVDATSQVRFAHVSTPAGARAILSAKGTHPWLRTEVTPHHLFVDASTAARRIGPSSRVNPQLRSASAVKAMRGLLEAGAFDFLASDHAPHTREEKLKGAPGFTALELTLPLFLTKTGNLRLLCAMYCEAPASYLGIKKGRISPGYIADLVILGRTPWTVEPDRFYSKGRVTPFAGEEVRYSVDSVLMGGRTVFRDGKFLRHRTRLVT